MLRLCGLLAISLLACLPAFAAADEPITPAEAAAKVGRTVTVHMKVKSIGTNSNGFDCLCSESTLTDVAAFFVGVGPEIKEKFKAKGIADVKMHFRQQYILVTGKIKLVKYATGDHLQIDIDDPSAIESFDPDALQPPGEEIVQLYKSGKLFQRTAYKDLRAAFARRFENAHKSDLQKAYGKDFDEFAAWLAKNPEVKENFYTALLERDDNIPNALALFKEIWKTYPDTLPKWNQLAIATAVTWDDEHGVYDYQTHQKRVKSILPSGMMNALDNFKYVVDNEKRIPQPIAAFPWEFLVFVVNHRTPLPEREWAFSFYQAVKGRSKSWHQDVPYDYEVIKREFDNDPRAADPKLAGKEYTLANIRICGGVCAHQADFACRTAQSLGIPAVYCSGSSAYRDSHAWWMYIGVTSATKDDIKFVLVSDGRFDGKDNFYTGRVLDPHSGTLMLDRDMERRLWITGTDRLGKRMSELIMRSFPALARVLSFSTEQKVAYLDQCLKVSKYNEDAWLQFARMAKRGELSDENKKIALGHLASLSKTFANYPDFIWRVFDDLVEVATPAEKTKQFDSALQLFFKAKRADLVCDARLKQTDVLVAQSKNPTAFSGLSAAVRQFPNEGRYVPKLFKKLEDVSSSVKGGPAQVAQLYFELIPSMIVYYRSENASYCKKMREQAQAFFNQNNMTDAGTALDLRIAQAKATLGKKLTDGR